MVAMAALGAVLHKGDPVWKGGVAAVVVKAAVFFAGMVLDIFCTRGCTGYA